MKRKTLDTIFAGGGLIVALLLGVLGYILIDQSAFATNYVKDMLGAQKITFAQASTLTDSEKSWKPGSTCLVTYAGQTMETGAQAECYAKYFISEHMASSATAAGFPGATYATLGPIRSDLTAQITAAKTAGDTTKAADLQKSLDSATSLRSTLQSGDSLVGMLLTVYGFSVIAEKIQIAAYVLYALAALMVVLSVAGFIHRFVTPEDKVVFGIPTGAPVRA